MPKPSSEPRPVRVRKKAEAETAAPAATEAPPSEPKPKPPKPFYFAVLGAIGKVKEDGAGGYALSVKGVEGLRLPLGEPVHGRPPEAWKDRKTLALFLLRSDAEGRLTEERLLLLGKLDDKSKPPLFFQARGRLQAADRTEGLIVLEVRPNPVGKLQEAFQLYLWMPLALFDELPPPGGGVYVQGAYRPQSRRLVVEQVQKAALWDDPKAEESPPS